MSNIVLVMVMVLVTYVMNGAISVSLNLVAICLLLVIVVYVSNGTVAMNTLCQCYCASNCIVLTICSLQVSSAQVLSFSFQLKNLNQLITEVNNCSGLFCTKTFVQIKLSRTSRHLLPM